MFIQRLGFRFDGATRCSVGLEQKSDRARKRWTTRFTIAQVSTDALHTCALCREVQEVCSEPFSAMQYAADQGFLFWKYLSGIYSAWATFWMSCSEANVHLMEVALRRYLDTSSTGRSALV